VPALWAKKCNLVKAKREGGIQREQPRAHRNQRNAACVRSRREQHLGGVIRDLSFQDPAPVTRLSARCNPVCQVAAQQLSNFTPSGPIRRGIALPHCRGCVVGCDLARIAVVRNTRLLRADGVRGDGRPHAADKGEEQRAARWCHHAAVVAIFTAPMAASEISFATWLHHGAPPHQQVGRREYDVECAKVLFEVFDALGAGDVRDDVVSPVPAAGRGASCEGLHPFRSANSLDLVDYRSEVALEVSYWNGAGNAFRGRHRQIFRATNLTSESPSAKGYTLSLIPSSRTVRRGRICSSGITGPGEYSVCRGRDRVTPLGATDGF